jgi:hypothetical protein
MSTKIRNYEGQLLAMRKENEEFFNKTKALGDNERKIMELQTRIQQYERELERISQGARSKEEELLTLRGRLR